MAAGTLATPLRLERGIVFRKRFHIKAAGVAVDLTGCSATCHLYDGSPESPGNRILASSTAGDYLTIDGDAEDGILLWEIPSADTDDVDVGDYWAELIITFTDNEPVRTSIVHVQSVVTGSEDGTVPP